MSKQFPAIPDRVDLEAQVRQLLDGARKRTGVAIEDLVRALGDFQPRGAETRRSWYDWQDKPESVSLLTGLAVMHVIGEDAAVELIFGSKSPLREPPISPDLAVTVERHAAELQEVKDELARLEREVAEQQRRLDELQSGTGTRSNRREPGAAGR